MEEAGELAGHAFISYVREDSDEVYRLQQVLEDVGVRVWRDTRDLWPGEDWRAKIQDAITRNALVFVACFSRRSVAREKSYQNEELTLAVEQMRLRPPGRVWLIPVRLDDCAIPSWDLGGGRTLASIQHADLFGEGRDEAVNRLVQTVLRILGEHSSSEDPKISQPGLTSPERVKFAARYFRGVLQNPKILRWEGKQAAGNDDLFIPGRAVCVDLISRINLRDRELSLQSLPDLISLDGKRDPLLLLGDPGAGKTTALQYYTLEQALRFAAGKPSFPVVPIALNLYSGDLRRTVQAAVNAVSGLTLSVGDACSFAQESGNLICFDGLNELGDFRDQGVREISAWMARNPQLSFIITCRWGEYEDDLELDFGWRILPFRNSEIREYLTWHSTVRGIEIYRAITADNGLFDLSSNPLILRMLCEAAPTGPLPKQRGPLYALCVNTMLRRQGSRNRHRSQIPFDVRRRMLAYLAFKMQSNNVVRYSARQINDCFTEFLNVWHESYDWRDLLNSCTSSGLLLEEDESYIFLHQTIQEYFAAQAIEDQGMDTLDNEESVLGRAQWNEVLLLLAGITRNPSELLGRLVTIDPVMTVKCISHGASPSTSVIDSLLRALNSMAVSANWVDRRTSADLIGELGRSSAHTILLALLYDENSEVRWGAVYALRNIGVAGAMVPALVDRLHDQFWVIQGEAAITLAHLGAVEAIPAVADLLSSGNSYVRGCAIDALVRFCEGSQEGEKAVSALLTGPSCERKELILFAISVAEAGTERTARLEAALGDASIAIVEAAIRMLITNPGNGTVDKIAAFASNENSSLRSTAVAALGKLQAREYLNLVGQALLTDEDEIVRGSAATALGEMYAAEAEELLIRSVADDSPGVRFAIARSLGRLQIQAARPQLRKWAADDPDVRVRVHAIRALGFLGLAEDVAFLERCRDHECDREVLDSLDEAISNLQRGRRKIRF